MLIYPKFHSKLCDYLYEYCGKKKNSYLANLIILQVKIQFAKSVNFANLKEFLSGKQNGKTVQDTVQALDIVLREMPSNHFQPIGRSFFPMDGQSRPIGEGCEVKFGFYQSVRPSEWKVMLVNIDG